MAEKLEKIEPDLETKYYEIDMDDFQGPVLHQLKYGLGWLLGVKA